MEDYDAEPGETETTIKDSNTSPEPTADDYLSKCSDVQQKLKGNSIFGYININSIRYKMEEIRAVVFKLKPLVFSIAETKLDDSFPTSQFYMENYHAPFRKDRTAHGGAFYAMCDPISPAAESWIMK